MQIIIYKLANNSLFIDRIEEKKGDGFSLYFPENVKGKCHLGKHILKIENGKCTISIPLSRSVYPLFIEGDEMRFEGEGLVYKDGKFHRALSEETSRTFYEIATLKEQMARIAEEVKMLSDTVFRTVIF